MRVHECNEVLIMADDSSEITREMAESVAATNLKTLGDGPAFFQNQMYAQAVATAAGYASINQAIIGKVAESIIATSPAEGGADLAALGMLIKGMQTVPPVTG
jgi:hypothetical protein